jgi:hypothetical protein
MGRMTMKTVRKPVWSMTTPGANESSGKVAHEKTPLAGGV